MYSTNQALGGFEERLLTQLKEQLTPAPTTARSARRRLVPVLAAVATSVAAMLGASIALGAFSSPAYAVEREPDGSIRIGIKEYKDPKGLERKLRGFGVNAVIDYLPSGKQCKEPRATYAPNDSDLFSADVSEKADEQVAWLLHPERIRPGQTLIYTVWLFESGDDSGSTGRWSLASGPVAACELVSGGPQVGPGRVTTGD